MVKQNTKYKKSRAVLFQDVYIPEDGVLDAICYNGTWYVKTNAGNLQTAREILSKRDR